MKRSRMKRFFEKKAVFLVLALCLLSAAGMYGMYRMELSKAEDTDLEVADGLVDLNEPVDEAASRIQVNGQVDSVESETAGGSAIAKENEQEVTGEDALTASGEKAADSQTPAGEDPETLEEGTAAIGGAEALHFREQDKIKWPVKGNIIMDFSPENTIYFATLDQYRCNPAIFIQATTGTQVVSCADGVVTSVSSDEEFGTMVTMDMGDGYQAIYGQLENVQVKQNSVVAAGDVIANVSTPSKYFGVEGSHLYFQLLKDGEPVNPRAYLE